jgi:hypothetical protein
MTYLVFYVNEANTISEMEGTSFFFVLKYLSTVQMPVVERDGRGQSNALIPADP